MVFCKVKATQNGYFLRFNGFFCYGGWVHHGYFRQFLNFQVVLVSGCIIHIGYYLFR